MPNVTPLNYFCKNDNYHCKCWKCKLALERAKQEEFSKIDNERKKVRKKKLTSELLKELV